MELQKVLGDARHGAVISRQDCSVEGRHILLYLQNYPAEIFEAGVRGVAGQTPHHLLIGGHPEAFFEELLRGDQALGHWGRGRGRHCLMVLRES